MITPIMAAIIIGSFWTGVGVTAVASHDGMWDHAPRTDVVISASPVAGHNDRCHARYRSYDDETDMYMGFDGSWHVCKL